MYYIYHIKGKKWGMTNDLQRRLSQQGYTSADEVIEEADLDKAADLEKKLNIRDGYGWNDSQDYRIVLKAIIAASKVKHRNRSESEIERWRAVGRTQGKIIGPIQGKKNVESGHMERMRAKTNPSLAGKIGGKISANKKSVCPYCGKEGQSRAMGRWHFENCKKKR